MNLAAWFLVLTLNHGRAWNFEQGAWTQATTPGIEVGVGPLALNASASFDRGGYFMRDLTLTFERAITPTLSLGVSGGRTDYPALVPDWTWNTSIRWTIK